MRLQALALTLSLLIGLPITAAAEESVVVLGLRSVEGDDTVALSLSKALRKAAGEMPDWLVRDQSISLAQMMLVHGCSEVDLPCLGTIATGLSVDRLVFGDLHHDNLTNEHNLRVEIQLYSANNGAIDGTASAGFPDAPDSAVLDNLAHQLLAQARPGAGSSLSPILTVSSNVEGAEVRLDGELIGQIQGGSLRLPDLQPGTYAVELSAIGYQPASQTLELAGGEATTLDLKLIPTTDQQAFAPEAIDGTPVIAEGGGSNVLAYALFGVGALSLAGMVTSWVIIENVGNKKIYQRYRSTINTLNDVCVAAKRGHDAGGDFTPSEVAQVVDVCDTADTFEILQYVFAGVAAAAVITGTALLVLNMDEEEQARALGAAAQPRLSVRPIVGFDHGGISAQLRF